MSEPIEEATLDGSLVLGDEYVVLKFNAGHTNGRRTFAYSRIARAEIVTIQKSWHKSGDKNLYAVRIETIDRDGYDSDPSKDQNTTRIAASEIDLFRELCNEIMTRAANSIPSDPTVDAQVTAVNKHNEQQLLRARFAKEAATQGGEDIASPVSEPATQAESWWNQFSRDKPAGSAQIVCPHCGVKGQVEIRRLKKRVGVSGERVVVAIITLGLSIPSVGVSRKQVVTRAKCSNCGVEWQF